MRRAPAVADQRHPRPVQDRGGQARELEKLAFHLSVLAPRGRRSTSCAAPSRREGARAQVREGRCLPADWRVGDPTRLRQILSTSSATRSSSPSAGRRPRCAAASDVPPAAGRRRSLRGRGPGHRHEPGAGAGRSSTLRAGGWLERPGVSAAPGSACTISRRSRKLLGGGIERRERSPGKGKASSRVRALRALVALRDPLGGDIARAMQTARAGRAGAVDERRLERQRRPAEGAPLPDSTSSSSTTDPRTAPDPPRADRQRPGLEECLEASSDGRARRRRRSQRGRTGRTFDLILMDMQMPAGAHPDHDVVVRFFVLPAASMSRRPSGPRERNTMNGGSDSISSSRP